MVLQMYEGYMGKTRLTTLHGFVPSTILRTTSQGLSPLLLDALSTSNLQFNIEEWILKDLPTMNSMPKEFEKKKFSSRLQKEKE